jgi:hypothetical protein
MYQSHAVPAFPNKELVLTWNHGSQKNQRTYTEPLVF